MLNKFILNNNILIKINLFNKYLIFALKLKKGPYSTHNRLVTVKIKSLILFFTVSVYNFLHKVYKYQKSKKMEILLIFLTFVNFL